MPTTYSIHDYGDPAGSGLLGQTRTDELTAFDAALARDTAAARAPATQLWVTESGVNLTDRDLGYAEARSLRCTGAPGSTLPFTLGACLDGNASAQAAARAGVLRPAVGHGRPAGDRGLLVPIRRVPPAAGTRVCWTPWSGPAGVLRVDAAAGHCMPGRSRKQPGEHVSARVALATCAELPQLGEDEPLLLDALRDRGIDAEPAVWDDPGVDWAARSSLVVVRSAWDYAPRRDEFVAWARSLPRLLNPADVIAWNTDKRYLGEDQRAVDDDVRGPRRRLGSARRRVRGQADDLGRLEGHRPIPPGEDATERASTSPRL